MRHKSGKKSYARLDKNANTTATRMGVLRRRETKKIVFDEVTTDAVVSHFLCTMEKNGWK